ncbi:tocopherol cyclase family protein [Alkalibaculum bacchi]|uniref:tocopherol cyclase family protein n=1 Tax=Alkalibaculum bacchi TaxID=645887 RepID=UPI0026EDD73B|nr:tocopherol cyclase family protein [Alkalibaculum bacchi]
MYRINRLFNPEIFLGKYRKKNYFEGWYFKLIDEDKKCILSIISGIAINKNGEKKAFIQTIDGITGQTHYIPFDYKDFKYDNENFQVFIGNNYFSKERMILNLEKDDLSFIGELYFTDRIPYPKTITHPGIMGPFSFVPFMECYHGVVNISHNIQGKMIYQKRIIDFNNGYGYIEKDWGKSFPESWIWVQSNHFTKENTSFMFSIAKIPWFGSFFIGFISFLRIGDNHHTFATYTRSKIKYLNLKDHLLSITLKNSKYQLQAQVDISTNKGELMAPKIGTMNRKIEETINSKVSILLLNKDNNIIFKDTGYHGGTELCGSYEELLVGSR